VHLVHSAPPAVRCTRCTHPWGTAPWYRGYRTVRSSASRVMVIGKDSKKSSEPPPSTTFANGWVFDRGGLHKLMTSSSNSWDGSVLPPQTRAP
jgi:hypothetical protein